MLFFCSSAAFVAEPLVPLAMEVPSQVMLREVCCVGLSTQGSLPIRNSSAHWLQAHLQVTALSIDGQPADADALPFVMKERLTIEPEHTEDIKVSGLLIQTLRFFYSLPLMSSYFPSSGDLCSSVVWGVHCPCAMPCQASAARSRCGGTAT